jgi:hypothetical protein
MQPVEYMSIPSSALLMALPEVTVNALRKRLQLLQVKAALSGVGKQVSDAEGVQWRWRHSTPADAPVDITGVGCSSRYLCTVHTAAHLTVS